MRVVSLFSGVGGLDLAALTALNNPHAKIIAHAENDPAATQVLATAQSQN